MPLFPASGPDCIHVLFSPSGKPSSSHPVRVLGRVLRATLQELELAELHNRPQSNGWPLYCQGLFDAITIGEVPIEVFSSCLSSALMFWLLQSFFKSGKSAQTKDESVVSLTSVFPFNLHPDQNATVFVFRANLYWTVSTAGTVRGPLPLLQRWPHLPAAIEAAAFSPMDFKWYFFKGAGLTSACKSHGAAF